MFFLDKMINICHITIDAWFCLYLLTLSNSSSLMNLKISVTLLSQKDISCVWLQSPVLTDASSCFLLLWYQSPHLRSPATEQMNWISCNYLKTMSRPTTHNIICRFWSICRVSQKNWDFVQFWDFRLGRGVFRGKK